MATEWWLWWHTCDGTRPCTPLTIDLCWQSLRLFSLSLIRGRPWKEYVLHMHRLSAELPNFSVHLVPVYVRMPATTHDLLSAGSVTAIGAAIGEAVLGLSADSLLSPCVAVPSALRVVDVKGSCSGLVVLNCTSLMSWVSVPSPLTRVEFVSSASVCVYVCACACVCVHM